MERSHRLPLPLSLPPPLPRAIAILEFYGTKFIGENKEFASVGTNYLRWKKEKILNSFDLKNEFKNIFIN